MFARSRWCRWCWWRAWGLVGLDLRRIWASRSALSSVVVQVARQLLELYPSAQLAEVLVFQHRLAIDRILNSFELSLQMVYPRLERPDRRSQLASG